MAGSAVGGRAALVAGDRLGPYEIVGILGTGGMGIVYRARDSRLARDVALKVLRSAATPELIERLQREARAAGSLNHPNIVAVFDVGTDAEVPYVVSELLEGRSLGQRLEQGRLPYRKALEYGIQIAHALGAAHAKGICHRDIKPGNVFITSDGRVKLLDFGLVKMTEPSEPADSDGPTADNTAPGRIHGTYGYMSPEQAVGEPVDGRTDLFSLGVVLYEMFTGARAFLRDSAAETLRAVLTDEPTDALKLNPALPPASVDIVRRCLEKNREERFQSARDLAFQLQQLSQGPSSAASSVAARRPLGGRRIPWPLILAGLVIAVLLGERWLRRRPAEPTFEQLTFHRGRIGGARFASEGVVYSQAQEGNALQVWHRLRDSPEPRALGYAADVLAARGGELALSTRRRFVVGDRFLGTLAVVPIGGGAPHELLDNVEDADWNPGGTELAVSRWTGAGRPSRLEYPPGKLLYESPGSIRHVRVSPDGRRVAFLEDSGEGGVGGRVALVDVEGRHRFLTGEWARARGLAWSPTAREIWFTAALGRMNRVLRAVDLEGEERVLLESPASLTLWDTAGDGRVLLTRDDERQAVVGAAPGETSERDLSWFDKSGLAALSDDGRQLLIGDRFGIYVRPTSGGPPVDLGLKDGWADDLSPDGRFALAETSSMKQLMLLPTGPGEPRALPAGDIATYGGALWFPDGRRVLVNGREPGRGPRAYIQDVTDGLPRALTPENTWGLSISSDGQQVATIGQGQGMSIWPASGAPARPVPGSELGDRPVAFSTDGRSLWVFRRGEIPVKVFRVEVDTGRRTLWKTLVPPDPAGVYSIINFQITPSGNAYFYGYSRVLSELYVLTGVR
jgi:eukaryotic-like serine/threonine-protein kinase